MKLLTRDEAEGRIVAKVNTFCGERMLQATHFKDGDTLVMAFEKRPVGFFAIPVTNYNELSTEELYQLSFLNWFEYQATNDSRDRQ